ncbi:MAG: TRAP transporter substrate-binding protein [Burkholderiaceae bacterium]|nr:TRAP transporter substrate-binding protein [Burkholderiaceae bacterium]
MMTPFLANARALLFSSVIGLIFGLFGHVNAQPLPPTELSVVGGLSSRLSYIDVERPFWTRTLPERSKASVAVQIKGFDEMGLKGQELLRLMSQGVIEFGVVPLSYYAPTIPVLEAIDIAGLATDAKTARDIANAFTPVLSHHFESVNQVKLLGIAPYGAQIFFCQAEVRSLADLRGLTIRTITRTQAELVEALGAKSVSMPFKEVFQALEKKSIHCAIAGATTGFNAKWYAVSTHLYALPVGWNQEVHAVNLKAWEKLPEPMQVFLESNLKDLIDKLWLFSEKSNQRGIECNTGSKECLSVPRGQMTLVQPTQADLALIKRLSTQKVLTKWAERCSDACVTDYNQTIGKLLKNSVKK